jgi:hypothetical protein
MSIIEQVSELTILNDVKTELNDPYIDQALDYVVKLIEKPDDPALMAKAAPLIVRLQALAVACNTKGKYYQCFGTGKDDANKKNMYFTIGDGLDKLVAALKYYIK